MRKLIVTGMPRSGTSWLGQIINSSPDTVFRTEPLFSYRFKNAIDERSPKVDIEKFFDDILNVDDDFILQKANVSAGYYPTFYKRSETVLAYKTTRHHELLEHFLRVFSDVFIVAIVRHPCGSINSWIKSDREFSDKGCRVEQDWRSGACRKGGIGEYWGFDDWLAVSSMFLELEAKYPNFSVVRYVDIVSDTLALTNSIFQKIGLEMTDQTHNFIIEANARDDDDPYSVYKSRNVVDQWKSELDEAVKNEIIVETHRQGLEIFLV